MTDDGLSLGPDGAPDRPLRRIDLDAWHGAGPDEVLAAAHAAEASTGLVVGTATALPPDHLQPLVHALTLTLVGAPVTHTQETVSVNDVVGSFAELEAAVAHRPRTAVALGQLLRQTALLPVPAGLAAEAAVYSMLLSGTEFAAWCAEREAPRPAAVRDDLVRVDRSGPVLAITLNRPERRNALSFAVREQLYAALELAVVDDTITRVELAGVGPAFCSGGDLAEFGTADDLVAAYLVRLDRAPWRLIDLLQRRGTVVTAYVQGAAIGAGAEIAAFADQLSCGDDARFRLPEVAMGLVPGAGGTVSVVRRIGRWRAAWLMLSGDTLNAADAFSWGLVDQVGTAR